MLPIKNYTFEYFRIEILMIQIERQTLQDQRLCREPKIHQWKRLMYNNKLSPIFLLKAFIFNKEIM